MKTNALSVANYLIELAQKEKTDIKLLGLVKRVYIAHGFSLALRGEPLVDSRFDKVEAWKYGPVIPSVYHSFKQYRDKAITRKTEVMEWNEVLCPIFVEPTVSLDEERRIVEMVWKRYHGFTDSELVTITHKEGTPWRLCYREGENVAIPDELTALYYTKLIENVRRAHGLA